MKGEYCDLGMKPKSRNAATLENSTHYPSLSIDMEKFPALGEMKLGSTGKAEIVFRLNPKFGGMEVLKIKMLGQGPAIADKKSDKKYEKPAEG